MDTDPAQSDASERECDKLLSRVTEEVTNGQRYVNNAENSNKSPQHTAGFSGNVTGDHMSTTSHSTVTKQSDFQQLRIVEGAQSHTSEKTANIKRKILKFAVSFMFLVMAVGVIAIWTFHDGGKTQKLTKYFYFDEDDLLVNVEIADEDDVVKTLSGYLGGVVFTGTDGTPRQPETCKRKNGNNHCLYWDEGTTLKVKLLKFDNGAQCYDFSWENISVIIPEDCYYLRHGKWFGSLSFSSEIWPISNKIPLSIYGPGLDRKFGNVVEYYWLSTSGSAIYIMQDSPIQLTWNTSKVMKFCISPLVSNYPGTLSFFNYSVCQGPNMKKMHNSISRNFFAHLKPYANRTVSDWLTSGIHWSYNISSSYLDKTDFNKFLTKLKQNGFSSGVVDIRSKLEKEYGDMMILGNGTDDLKLYDISSISQDFEYIITVYPVCSFSSPAFTYGLKNNLLIKDSVTSVTKLIKFQEKDVALWNIHNITTREWLKSAIVNIINKTNIKHIKFAALDTALLSLDDRMTSVGDQFYQHWSKLLSDIESMPVLQSTFRSQNIPAFIEIRENIIDVNNQKCLSHILPAALTYAIFGYPFVISNIYLNLNFTNYHDELFIRWFQLSLFLPALSIPSDVLSLDQNTVDYIKNAMFFRQGEIYPKLQSLLLTVSESNPVIKPLWWTNENDKKTFSIDDQFLFGEDVLVAPILCSESRSRDVYLPEGKWLHPGTNVLYTGEQLLKDFNVPLYEIAYFILQEEESM